MMVSDEALYNHGRRALGMIGKRLASHQALERVKLGGQGGKKKSKKINTSI